MSLRRPRFQEEEPAESINISPLIDVIFILLIFFIVTMVFADSTAMKVDVPKASHTQSVDDKPLTIAIHSDSTVSVRNERFGIRELQERLRRMLTPARSVVLRSDSSVPVSVLVAVMDCAKECGAKEIYIAAEKK